MKVLYAYTNSSLSLTRPSDFPPREMLTLGKLTTWPQCNAAFPQNPKSQTLIFQAKTHQNQVSFSPNGLPHLALFGVLEQSRTGFCIYASNSQKSGGNSLLEMDNVEEDDDFFDDDEEEEEGFDEEGDEDEEFVVPLSNMKKWLENKPRGFGEGKVYDTSIEDKLMEEIEQSREAQLANINNLKNNPVSSISKKEQGQQEKDSKGCNDGFRVRLVNLPKKKNIHRDLQLAFKGVPGIVDIVPVVLGNKRTKDPICKGLAFIDFKTENEAYRFVQTFSGQNITFGKVQKQIKCDMNFSILKPENEHSDEEIGYTAEAAVQTEELDNEFESEDDVHKSVDLEDNEGLGTQGLSLPESSSGDGSEEREESVTKPSSFKQKRELPEKEKRLPSKRKKERLPKINIPGSANRLKIKEKSLLTGVLSKYAANNSLATSDQN